MGAAIKATRWNTQLYDHQALVQDRGRQEYRNRAYISHLLDDRHFHELNRTPAQQLPSGSWVELGPAHVLGLQGYCLDAPTYMPSGSMQACKVSGFARNEMAIIERGVSLAEAQERERLMDELVAELTKGK